MVIVDECTQCGALRERGKWTSRKELNRKYGELRWLTSGPGILSQECVVRTGMVKEGDPGIGSLPKKCKKL